MILPSPPTPTTDSARSALRALTTHRSLLLALQAFRDDMGDIFSLSLPGFKAIVLSGPEAAHFTYVEARADLSWRTEDDPVTSLLQHGLLVEDGDSHDALRKSLMPQLHRQKMEGFSRPFVERTDQVCQSWDLDQPLDMLVEMRRAALLILMDTLFEVDITPDLDRLWPAILRTLKYISPGPWLLWHNIPRPGYQWALRQVDEYIYGLIAAQKKKLPAGDNMLAQLIDSGMSDSLIRDQILTILIAGHDTSTALLTWAIYLLTSHPPILEQVQDEIRHVLGDQIPTNALVGELSFLEQVINETLRLYPPIHVSNRRVLQDLEFNGRRIPAGSRLMFSIYLTHHDKKHWEDAERFDPSRFAPGIRHQPYTFVPFGGGQRNCIGAAFAQVEAKVVLARLFQRYNFTLVPATVRQYMGATLEPQPGVLVKVSARL